ncbi:DUF1254 domain-containing protein [Sandaracinobacter sp. RS1-74]|uniref:DUF1254 domain-containing protein n=1 Tax=Sandaracinobacteroides sayramensis TaxID=2913411 RepID=UPI001EDB6549|nr:DUF1254 domain-containing protein [Sandaracinobacteroides sayramensis]MCG2842046.1 DUF1254 domain-containing protein [Sandaracinobacteroides sayramensis]
MGIFRSRAALLLGLAALAGFAMTAARAAPEAVSPDEARAIAREAFIYAAAPVQSYGTWYKQAVDPKAAEYVGGFNRFRHYAEVFTPDNKDIVTPNNDTPYSWAWLDLRAEPMVLSVPEVEEDRYYVMQLIDLFTHNFAYVGTRATGNGAGNFLIAGPKWKGGTPAGIRQVLRSESDIVGILGRTQLKGANDLSNVHAVQAGYRLEPLSAFLGGKAPAPAPAPLFPPFDPARASGAESFAYLNMLLAFAQPPVGSETALLKRFARIGIAPGQPWPPRTLDPAVRAAIDAGVADAKAEIATAVKAAKSSNGLFGTRDELGNDYMKRTVGARIGIYGNSLTEAWYGGFTGDGTRLVRLHFPAGQLPPAAYFWSMTLYTLPDRLLYANPEKRYSIGSETPGLVQGADGSLTLYIGHQEPGADKRANWIPAPAAPYTLVARLYGPNEDAIEGRWKLPAPEPLQ